MNGDEIRRRRAVFDKPFTVSDVENGIIHVSDIKHEIIGQKLDLILDILEGELDVLTMGIEVDEKHLTDSDR